MENKNCKITKIIAYTGTVLVWAPLFFMVITSIIGSIANQRFLMDILMPAELFPSILGGSALLIWAAIRCKDLIKMVSWTFVVMIATLFGSQGAAILTGLAHGDTQPEGWPFFLVMFLMAVYIGTSITEGVLGVMMIKDLRKPT